MTSNALRNPERGRNRAWIGPALAVLLCGSVANFAWAETAKDGLEEMPCHGTEATSAPTVAVAGAEAEPVAAVAPALERGPNPFADHFPDVVLRAHDGRTVRFYDDLIKDKIVMINFMYATCKGR